MASHFTLHKINNSPFTSVHFINAVVEMSAQFLLLCSLLALLAVTTSVNHWKLQDGVIRPVKGKCIITDKPPSTDEEENGSEGDEGERKDIIYDKELYLLMTQSKKSQHFIPRLVRVTPHNLDEPLLKEGGLVGGTGGPSNNKLKLQITQHKAGSSSSNTKSKKKKETKDKRDLSSIPLTCGEPVESTPYDFLEGVARRDQFSIHPEPDVAMVFKKTTDDQSVDLVEVEKLLKKLLNENSNDPQVFNQVGNLWRVKGNTLLAIECFRKALSVSPNDPDALINMARTLYNLKFIDDTLFLTKLSLHHKFPKSETWLQHYTLGEAYKVTKKYETAAAYFKKALELNPSLSRAEAHLRDLERQSSLTNFYTVIIILFLVSFVIIIISYLIYVRN